MVATRVGFLDECMQRLNLDGFERSRNVHAKGALTAFESRPGDDLQKQGCARRMGLNSPVAANFLELT